MELVAVELEDQLRVREDGVAEVAADDWVQTDCGLGGAGWPGGARVGLVHAGWFVLLGGLKEKGCERQMCRRRSLGSSELLFKLLYLV